MKVISKLKFKKAADDQSKDLSNLLVENTQKEKQEEVKKVEKDLGRNNLYKAWVDHYG